MPIYEQTYRNFEGALRQRFRWWTMVRQEWRVIRKSRLFWLLTIPTAIHFIACVVYIYTYDAALALVESPGFEQSVETIESLGLQDSPERQDLPVLQDTSVQQLTQNLSVLKIDRDLFYWFILRQSVFVFPLCIFAGAGLICNDFRYNLVEVYFSKPLSWVDYTVGKVMSLVLLGLATTALPAVLLLLLHLGFSQTLTAVKEVYWVPVPIFLFSLVIVLPTALAVLASSSFFNSQRFAAISVFMVLMMTSGFGGALAGLLGEEQFFILAFPIAVIRLGEFLFNRPSLAIEVSSMGSALYILAVCTVCLLIVCRRVRRAGATA